ncbi:imelysin family protein [Mangrovimonas sp. DI 80]|uniref:imelysin family protein n=1 Tax=Mangrovimonas sp. DI 80 TaxID=1779330 RepID=UPI0009768CCC|nr:imelysin family protein [Mangrovimonas sp. DI 80]OMP32733.1 imelysin [Mangrovimonas sp. DI 80]
MSNSIKSILMLVFISTVFVSCSDSNEDSNNDDAINEALYQEVLTNLSVSVITETYNSMNNNAIALKEAVANLTIGDETALQTVKEAWQATRQPWENSEGFLYGPVDTEGIDPAIDSWPVDVNAINGILNSGNPITQSLLESNNEARGFHTIEYFVWGIEGDKAASELTERELEYLVAATENLQSKTAQLYNGWIASGGNFANNFVNAGESGSIYTSQKGALQEIVEGLSIIADEVGNGKIEEPLNGNNGGAKPEAEESRFSNNSKLDFSNNMRSILNVYVGDYNGINGKGISEIVATVDSSLDQEIQGAITAAIYAIDAIPGTFTEAIYDNRDAVGLAQEKVLELQSLLDSQLLPLIGNL